MPSQECTGAKDIGHGWSAVWAGLYKGPITASLSAVEERKHPPIPSESEKFVCSTRSSTPKVDKGFERLNPSPDKKMKHEARAAREITGWCTSADNGEVLFQFASFEGTHCRQRPTVARVCRLLASSPAL